MCQEDTHTQNMLFYSLNFELTMNKLSFFLPVTKENFSFNQKKKVSPFYNCVGLDDCEEMGGVYFTQVAAL